MPTAPSHLSVAPPLTLEERVSALELALSAQTKKVESLAVKMQTYEETLQSLTGEFSKMRESFEDVGRTSKQVEARSVRAENLLMAMQKAQHDMSREVHTSLGNQSNMQKMLTRIAETLHCNDTSTPSAV